MRFAVIYQDKEVLVDGEIPELDPVGIQAIIYKDPATDGMNTGTICLRGWDYFLLENGSWVGLNGEHDLIDHVLHVKPQLVLKGRMLPRDQWQEALKRMEGFEFPPKSAEAKSFETPYRYVPDGT